MFSNVHIKLVKARKRNVSCKGEIMEITAQMVKELREQTGAGMMDCKKALVEAEGNMDKATEVLRQKGISSAEKKMGRIAAEGLVATAIIGNKGAMVEVNCETDFVAKNEEFKELVQNIAKGVLEVNPKTVKNIWHRLVLFLKKQEMKLSNKLKIYVKRQ